MNLKDEYNKAFVEGLATELSAKALSFNKKSFVDSVFNSNWEKKELKERMRWITESIHANLNIPYQATSLTTLVQMVASNIGVTLLPQIAVNANITHDTDVEIRSINANHSISRTIALVWRNNSPRSHEFYQLGELIKDHRSM